MNSNQELVSFLLQNKYADEKTANAMLANPRELFVSKEEMPRAYEDHPLPVGFGQTISAPSMVAEITRLLDLTPGMKVLEIGAGSGWQAAIIASMVEPEGKVYAVERIPELAGLARKNLEKTGHKNAEVIVGDGTLGLKQHAPFDGIVVSAAAPDVPPQLIEQLKDGRKMLIPLADGLFQTLTLVEKKKGRVTITGLMNVVFVPLIGEHGFKH